MGQFDSSRSRVAPVFDRLRAIDPTGREWLPILLSLPTRESVGHRAPSTLPLKTACWWPKERALPAPAGLLHWLVRNVEPPRNQAAWGGGHSAAKRRALTQRDPATVAEALTLLSSDALKSERAWFVLEGPSCPDVFLETDDLIVVIEGKRTESGPTTATNWMPVRHQMLRHLDAAWDIRDGRQCVGFFIVESDNVDGDVPEHWRDAARQTIRPDVVAQSLPHRPEDVRAQIADAFLGVTTWQRVCRALSIPESLLLDRVV